MKLATYQDGSRDGQLVVVSRDLSLAHYASGIASRLQQALDDWNFIAPQLQDLYATLNYGKARHAFPFEARKCMAPLPRASQWAQVAAWPAWLERVQAALPPEVRAVAEAGAASGGGAGRRALPLVAQAASDGFRGPCEDAVFPADLPGQSKGQDRNQESTTDPGLDFEAGLMLVAGDIPQGVSPAQALEGIRLMGLSLAWRQRRIVRQPWSSLAPWAGPQQVQAWGQVAPLLVTPDELGDGWQGGKAALTLHTRVAGRTLGKGLLNDGMAWHAGQCLALLARARPLRAGSLVSLGPVSHADSNRGQHSLLERWALNAAGQESAASFTGLAWGDSVQVELIGADGQSLCGAIDTVISDRDARDPHEET